MHSYMHVARRRLWQGSTYSLRSQHCNSVGVTVPNCRPSTRQPPTVPLLPLRLSYKISVYHYLFPYSLFLLSSFILLSFSTLLQQHTGTHNILVVKQPLIAISIHVRLPSFRYSPVSSVSASAFRRKNTDEAIFSDKANSQQLTNCGHRQKSKLSTKHNDTILYQAQLSTSEYTLTLDNESHESV